MTPIYKKRFTKSQTATRSRKLVPQPEKSWLSIYSDGREVLNLKTVQGRAEYQKRIELMCIRQEWACGCGTGCGKWLTMHDASPYRATFDHENGRGSGGANRDDRIYLPDGKRLNRALTLHCNIKKGSKRGY